MGVVAKQGIKYSLVGYLGYGIGVISSFLLFPMDPAFYGKLRYILPTAEMLVPFFAFGLPYAGVRYFGKMNQMGKAKAFLSLLLAGVFVFCSIFCAGIWGMHWVFPALQKSKFWQMHPIILPLAACLSFNLVFSRFLTNYHRIALPGVLDNLFPRLANVLAFSFFYFVLKEESISLMVFSGVFFLALLIYIVYTHRLTGWRIDWDTTIPKDHALIKQVIAYSFFGFLGNIGSYLALRIDNYMIAEQIGFVENGVYSNLYAIISLMTVPSLGIYSLCTPMIQQHLSKGEITELNLLHQRTSLNTFWIGGVLWCCILAGFPALTSLMKNGQLLWEVRPLVWILGGSMLVDLATGFNGQIISQSRYYHFSIYTMLMLSALTIGLNILFLHTTQWGIIGIGLAYGISLWIYNVVKLIFNYKKFGVHPFSSAMLRASICILGVGLLSGLFPQTGFDLLDLFLWPGIVMIVFFILNESLRIIDWRSLIKKKKN